MKELSYLISIIIPVYNTGKYLHRCVDSILAQTYTDFELLLIDDGSTDSSGAICDKYAEKDSRVRVFHKENGGVSSARNLGVDYARGEYIMFVDSDDYMFPMMCNIMKSTIERENVDCVICGTQESGGGYWKPSVNDVVSIIELQELMSPFLVTELLSPPWNKIFKRKLITTQFKEDISFGEDLIFNLEYFKNCEKIVFITDSPYFHNKENENSLVVKVQKERLCDIEAVLQAVLKFTKERSTEIYSKYFKDIVVYSRQILKSSLQYKDKCEILTEWNDNAVLKLIPISYYKGSWKNRLLLFFLKYKCWLLANIMVNKSFVLK